MLEKPVKEPPKPVERTLVRPEVMIHDEPLVSKQLLPIDRLLPNANLPAEIYGGIKIRASSTAQELAIGIAYLVNCYEAKLFSKYMSKKDTAAQPKIFPDLFDL